MGMMINRRRVIGGKKNNVDENSYIKDGLVFQLDGINKGSNPSYWTDLIGGIILTYNEHSIIGNDHVYFDGNGYIEGDSPLSSTGTVEICFEQYNTSNLVFIFSSGPYYRAAFFKNASQLYYNNTPLKIPGFYVENIPNNIRIVSIDSENLVINNQQIQEKEPKSLSYGTKNSSVCIGARSGNDYRFRGKIYSVRVYNRNLSINEMLFNQQIDNVRFNLGL